MSDNVVQFPSGASGNEPPQKKPRKLPTAQQIWRLIGIVIFVLILVALYLFRDSLNFDQMGRSFANWNAQAEDNYGAHDFGTYSTNRYGLYDGGLAISGISGLELYDKDSDLAEKFGNSMGNPALNLGNKSILAYDIGGSNLVVASETMEELLTLSCDGQILDGDLSAKDALVYSVAGSGSKTVITVCNDKLEEIYKWYSATQYMPLCTVNSDGSAMAATSMGQTSGQFQSYLYFFDTSMAEVASTANLGNQSIFDIEFLSDSQIVAIGEDSAQFFSHEGELMGLYDYSGKTLDQFLYWDDGEVTLSLQSDVEGNLNHLITLSADGELVAEATVDGVVVNISAAGSYLAVLTTEKLEILRNDLTDYSIKDNVIGTTVALMQSDGSCILIGGGTAQLFLP